MFLPFPSFLTMQLEPPKNNTNMASSDDGKQDDGEFDDNTGDQMASGPSEDDQDRAWLFPKRVCKQPKYQKKKSSKKPPL